jgi:hypothetical protein
MGDLFTTYVRMDTPFEVTELGGYLGREIVMLPGPASFEESEPSHALSLFGIQLPRVRNIITT